MFTEWSRPHVHLDPGEPERHKLILYFREGTVRNEKLSEGGPPVYDRVYQVEIAAVGQKQSRPRYTIMRIVQGVEQPCKDLMNLSGGPDGTKRAVTVYDRFKKAFEEYRANAEPTTSGIPLEHWPLMTTELVRAFKDANILSVEDLANAPDSAAQNVRGEFFKWRGKAQAWLEDSRKAGGDAKARAELAEVKKQLAEAQRQITELLAAANADRPEPRRTKRKETPIEVVFDEPEERL